MTNTTKFQFTFEGATYTFEGEPKQVANMRKSYDAARAKMETLVAQSVKRGRGRPRVEHEPSEAQKIRAWAASAGLGVGERGRLSAEVREAYEAAHSGK
jgi:hypothetical protein